MNLKKIVPVVAATFFISLSSMAADPGIKTELEDWGVILLPENVYIEKNTQNTLVASSKGYDMTKMLEDIYPVYPRPYQITIKDEASFQYGYMLRYSMSVWDLQQLFRNRYNNTTFALSEKPTLDTLAGQMNRFFKTTPPAGFRLLQPVGKVKKKSNTFYEGTLAYDTTVNDTAFTEVMRLLAWQHGSIVEIAVLMGSSADKDRWISDMAGILETAKEMPDY